MQDSSYKLRKLLDEPDYLDGNFDGPDGVVLRKGKAYMSQYYYDHVAICTLSPDGRTLIDCGFDRNESHARGIGMYKDRLYLTSLTDKKVSRCEFKSGGTLLSCTKNLGSHFGHPAGLAFHSSKRRMYVGNDEPGTPGFITICTMNGRTPTSCKKKYSNLFDHPFSVAVYGSNKLYITNMGSSKVVFCKIKSDGNLKQCRDANAAKVDVPSGITFSNKRAFIMNQNSTSSGKAITVCKLRSNGKLKSCKGLQGSWLRGPFGNPLVNGGFIVVPNSGGDNMISCRVSGSTISDCIRAAGGNESYYFP